MMRLLQIETYKIFKRQRTYIAFVVMAAIIFLIQIGLRFGGKEYVSMLMSAMNETFEVNPDEIINGYFVCFFIYIYLFFFFSSLFFFFFFSFLSSVVNISYY